MVETFPVPPHHEQVLGFLCLGSGGFLGSLGGLAIFFLLSGQTGPGRLSRSATTVSRQKSSIRSSGSPAWAEPR